MAFRYGQNLQNAFIPGADPGIFDWGVQTLGQKGLLDSFEANYFSPTPPPTIRSCTS